MKRKRAEKKSRSEFTIFITISFFDDRHAFVTIGGLEVEELEEEAQEHARAEASY